MRRAFDSRLVGAGLVAAVVLAPSPTWQRAAPVPVPRTEVAAARHGAEIIVVGGYLPWGATSDQADAYSPARDEWRRLPSLPLAVNHAMAATWRGKAYVLGGYTQRDTRSDRAFVLEQDGWRELPRMLVPRAAGGAAVVGKTLYVVGGVGPNGLAQQALAFDLVRERWRTVRGPIPREHLAVTTTQGRIYVLAGRTRGLDTNLRTFESWRPGERRWRRLPPVPRARGGTAAAAVGRTIVSVGGEATGGTIRSVYAYDTRTRRWRRLADLPTPRHGLGAVAVGRRVYTLAGGPQPGLTTSGVNEYLTLP